MAPLPRFLRVSPWLAAWLLALCASTPASAHRQDRPAVAPSAAITAASVRGLLDAGRYLDAEQAAASLVRTLEPAAATTPLDFADAIDLLLEARRRANHP